MRCATGPTPGCGKRSILLGFNAYFLLPVLTVGILLGWHHVLRQPWHVRRTVLYGMAGECLGLAVGLWLSWKLYRFLLQAVVHAARPEYRRFPGNDLVVTWEQASTKNCSFA